MSNSASSSLAERLLDSALDDDPEPTPSWLSMSFIGDRYWRVGPTGADLFGGLSGICLFLAEMDQLAPNPRRHRVGLLRTIAPADVPNVLLLSDRSPPPSVRDHAQIPLGDPARKGGSPRGICA